MFLPVWAMGWTFALDGAWLARAMGGGIALYFVFVIWAHTGDDWPEDDRRTKLGIARSLPAMELVLVPVLIGVDLLSHLFGDGSLALRLQSLPISYGLLLGLVIHLLAAGAVNGAVLSNVPLRQKVVDVLAKGPPLLPTYVTVAREVRWLDPDYPLIAVAPRDPGDPPHYYVTAGTNFAPKYLRIDGRPLEEVADLVTANAALPLGPIAPVSVEGEKVVDGGLADNVPVRPLLDHEACDVLFVFRLNREPEPAKDDLVRQHPDMAEHWKHCWRKEDVAAFEPDEDFLTQDRERYRAPASPTRIPWRMHPNV